MEAHWFARQNIDRLSNPGCYAAVNANGGAWVTARDGDFMCFLNLTDRVDSMPEEFVVRQRS